jgi:hypothetical protein
MRPENRYNRGKTLGQLSESKLALVAVCRRCKHQHMLSLASLIERFGEDAYAIDIRAKLRCHACGYGNANLHEAAR